VTLQIRRRRKQRGFIVQPFKMKVVGRRRPARGLRQVNNLLHLVIKLRSGRPFIPKGVHRFRSFEEAHQWSIQMQARKASPGRPR
jgi:hypothetical protein